MIAMLLSFIVALLLFGSSAVIGALKTIRALAIGVGISIIALGILEMIGITRKALIVVAPLEGIAFIYLSLYLILLRAKIYRSNKLHKSIKRPFDGDNVGNAFRQ